MNKTEWKYYLGKRVYVILESRRWYQGIVVDIKENGKTFMCVNDKFNNRVCFDVDAIESIQEERI